MKKTIMIESQPIEINSSLGWLFCYREQFGHDILPDLLPLLDAALGALADVYDEVDKNEEINIFEKLDDESISRIIVSLSTLEAVTVSNILWAMAKNAGENRGPLEWVNSFEVFPLDVIVPELIRAIVESSISSKNSKSLLEKIPTLSRSRTSLSPEFAED